MNTRPLSARPPYIIQIFCYIKSTERYRLVTAMNIKMLPAALFILKEPAKTDQDSMQITPAETGAIKNEYPAKNTAPPMVTAAVVDPKPQVTFRIKPKMHMTNTPKSNNEYKTSRSSFVIPEARYYLCTVTDLSYLIKVIAQYHSLDMVTHDFCIFVCCTDQESFRVLSALNLPRCILLSIDQLSDNELFALKQERKPSEFCWTLKSYIMEYLLKVHRLPHVLYCDGDIGFSGSLELLYDDWGDSAIYLCTQRDVDWVERKYGKYQAGILGIRNNQTGLNMLHWWKNKCREWCFAYEDNGRLGDQKYLDEVPGLFGDVKISGNKGINAAPWNIVYNNNYEVTAQGARVTIDGAPLVAYHFACLNIYDEQHFDLWSLDNISIQSIVRSNIYLPYLTLLREAMAIVKKQTADLKPMFLAKGFEEAKTPFIYSMNNLKLLKWNSAYAFCTVSSRTYVARTLALYNSIRHFLSNFHLWICCVDETAYHILSRFNLENTTLLHVKDVETPEILASRPTKTVAEYCWTLKPALCSHVFANYNVSRLLYCDSDIYFFSHPEPIHELWNNYTTLLNRQLGTPALENKHGMYQAGMIGFTKAPESLEILRWWQRKCTQWCYDAHSDPERWGDQKYLQSIPNLFHSIRVNDRYGLVTAPWNLVMNNVSKLQVSRAGNDIYLGNEKLVAYHFGSINMLSRNSFDLWKHEPIQFDKRVIEHIYIPYLTHLSAICREIEAKGFSTSPLFVDEQNVQNPFRLGASQETLYEKLRFADR